MKWSARVPRKASAKGALERIHPGGPIGVLRDAGVDGRVHADSRLAGEGALSSQTVTLSVKKREFGTAKRAIVVLGCRIAWTFGGQLGGAVGRRVQAAREVFEREECAFLVASGGRVWNGVVEADAMGDALVRLGVPKERVLGERCSFTTRGNARFTSALLSRIGIDQVLLVTCDWHATRASALFRRCGIRVEARPVRSPPAAIATRAWRWGRERVATRLDEIATMRVAAP